jgi:hypothetical protein
LSTVLFDFDHNTAHVFVGQCAQTRPLFSQSIYRPPLSWKPAVSVFDPVENMWEPNACLLPSTNGGFADLVILSTWLQPSDQTQSWAPAIVSTVSRDGGATFSEQEIIQDDPKSIIGGQADPVCSSHKGVVYSAWMDNWSLSSSSTVDGVTWTRPVLAVNTQNSSDGDSHKR